MQTIPCITLTPCWALGLVSMPAGSARVLSGVGLCGPQEWEVTAGSPEQRPPGLGGQLCQGGPRSASCHPSSGMDPEHPHPSSRPRHTSCDLETRALTDRSCPLLWALCPL